MLHFFYFGCQQAFSVSKIKFELNFLNLKKLDNFNGLELELVKIKFSNSPKRLISKTDRVRSSNYNNPFYRFFLFFFLVLPDHHDARFGIGLYLVDI